MLAIRHAALGGDVWRLLGMVTLLGIACLAIGFLIFRAVRARGARAGDAVAHMRRWLSVFLVGGNLAYRGLFNWIHPVIDVPTMLGRRSSS